jgi:ribulose-bisphosphate carboxylase small chain
MPARCTSSCTSSARTWCCSSAAAPSATRWASQPGPGQPRGAGGHGPGPQRGARHHGTRARTSWRPPRSGCTPLDTCARLPGRTCPRLRLRVDRHAHDFVPTATGLTQEPEPCAHPGTFSFLPDLTDEQIRAQVQYCLDQGWAVNGGVHRRPASPQHLLGHVGHPMFDLKDGAGHDRAGRVPQGLRRPLHPATAFDSTPGWESVRLSFIVNRPAGRAGLPRSAGGRDGRCATPRAYATDRPAGDAVRR